MQWWNSLVRWVQSDDGWRVVSEAVVPFVAILVAGVVAALIGRAALKRVVRLHDDEAKASAIAGIVAASRKAATWSSLGAEERTFTDHLAQEAEVRLRLLPVTGSGLAASWAEHQLGEIKRDSASYGHQPEQSLAEFRDRLLDWQSRPSRAKKLFRADLERWRYEDAEQATEAEQRQRDWKAERDGQRAAPASGSGPAAPARRADEPVEVTPFVPERRTPTAPTPLTDEHAAFRPTSPARHEPVRPRGSAPTEAMPAQRDSSDDGDDDTDRYGDPVSATQVRDRTTPDA
ncbi:hypothetical protein ASF82_09120 [Frigoribacterium sp. Leaf164]|uniref:hypothetical protein n=1 Tax=Frigoribacterium sp. Leaf164 TaxID=1736282 RepID=UPI0006F4BD72|nr:hypothetical protein [Frigoribacterium sp. Leaf164]KQR43780.1 hypothetical protein ASF82_09120 [Frigoribacterium sp. Leaf164]